MLGGFSDVLSGAHQVMGSWCYSIPRSSFQEEATHKTLTWTILTEVFLC